MPLVVDITSHFDFLSFIIVSTLVQGDIIDVQVHYLEGVLRIVLRLDFALPIASRLDAARPNRLTKHVSKLSSDVLILLKRNFYLLQPLN